MPIDVVYDENITLLDFLYNNGINEKQLEEAIDLITNKDMIKTKPTNDISFAKAKKLFLKNRLDGKSEETLKAYTTGLNQFHSFLKDKYGSKKLLAVGKIKHGDIEEFLSKLVGRKGEASSYTFNLRLATIRSFINYLIDHDYLEKNNISKVRYKKLKSLGSVYLAPEQLKAFLNEAREGQNGIRNYHLFLLIANTGLRLSEAINLKINDINFENGVINIRKAKGNKEGEVPLIEQLAEEMRYYLDFRLKQRAKPHHGQYVFISQEGKALSARTVQAKVEKIYKKLNIGGGGNIHRLRHTYALMLLDSGINLEFIRMALRHELVNTTTNYLRMGNSRLKEEIEKHFPRALITLAKLVVHMEDD